MILSEGGGRREKLAGALAMLAALALAFATLATTGATASAQDLPVVVPGVLPVAESNAASNVVDLPVTLSESPGEEVTVQWTTHFQPNAPGNQATPDTDYVVASGEVTFPVGVAEQTVPVTIKGDLIDEPDEYVLVSFHSPTNAVLDGFLGLGAVIIQDDDALRVITPGVGLVTEGDTSTVANVPVSLSGLSGVDVTVEWTTHFQTNAPGSQATPDVDYVVASGEVTFPVGVTEQTVPVTINGDLAEEPDEYVLVSFHSPTNAVLDGFLGLGAVIIDDDDAFPVLSPETSASRIEGDGVTDYLLQVDVTLSPSSSETVTVDYHTAFVDGLEDPQAEPGVDYDATSGTLVFSGGDTEETVEINLIGDVFTEPDEKVILEFENPVNAALANMQVAGTILNDDVPGITVTPDTGLNGGDVVTVDGSGYVPGSRIGACQALDTGGSSPASQCLAGTEAAVATAGVDGTFSFTKRLYRWGHVPAVGSQVDCADAANQCAIGFGALDDSNNPIPGTIAGANIDFAAPPDPPTTRGEITVVPDTDLVDAQTLTVTGTGFRADHVIDVYQCLSDPPHVPGNCDWSPRFETATNSAGEFSTEITAQAFLFGSTHDCTLEQCYVTALEAIDFVGTSVSAPVTFAAPPS